MLEKMVVVVVERVPQLRSSRSAGPSARSFIIAIGWRRRLARPRVKEGGGGRFYTFPSLVLDSDAASSAKLEAKATQILKVGSHQTQKMQQLVSECCQLFIQKSIIPSFLSPTS